MTMNIFAGSDNVSRMAGRTLQNCNVILSCCFVCSNISYIFFLCFLRLMICTEHRSIILKDLLETKGPNSHIEINNHFMTIITFLILNVNSVFQLDKVS